MKGQSELTETFIKLIQVGLVIVGALAIFFTYVSYELTAHTNDARREAYILGNAIMSSDCFTDGVKGLLVQSKINNAVVSCFDYTKGKIQIKSTTVDQTIMFGSGATPNGIEEDFNILIKLNDGSIENGKLKVML